MSASEAEEAQQHSLNEEERKLKDLALRKLTANGLLPRLRAQIRAAVLITLEDEEKGVDTDHFNGQLSAFLESGDGRLALDAIFEFLHFFKLDSTINVLSSEIGDDRHSAPRGDRETLMGSLPHHGPFKAEAPVLSSLLRNPTNINNNSTGKHDNSISSGANAISATTPQSTVNDGSGSSVSPTSGASPSSKRRLVLDDLAPISTTPTATTSTTNTTTTPFGTPGLSSVSPRASASLPSPDHVRSRFNHFDRNKDGLIDKIELRMLFSDLHGSQMVHTVLERMVTDECNESAQHKTVDFGAGVDYTAFVGLHGRLLKRMGLVDETAGVDETAEGETAEEGSAAAEAEVEYEADFVEDEAQSESHKESDASAVGVTSDHTLSANSSALADYDFAEEIDELDFDDEF